MTDKYEIPQKGWKPGKRLSARERKRLYGDAPTGPIGFNPDNMRTDIARDITDDGHDFSRPRMDFTPELLDLEERASNGDKGAEALLIKKLKEIRQAERDAPLILGTDIGVSPEYWRNPEVRRAEIQEYLRAKAERSESDAE